MEILLNSLGLSALSSLIVMAYLFIFKQLIIGFITKGIQKDIEGYKHELEIKKENIKHQLTKDSLKHEFLNSSKQTVYPELMRLILSAEGAVSQFSGFVRAPSWESMNIENIESYLNGDRCPKDRVNSILSKIRLEKDYKDLRNFFYESKLHEAQDFKNQFKNYFLEKSLFLSTEVKTKTEEISKRIVNLYVDAQMTILHKYTDPNSPSSSELKEELTSKINELEALMAKELFEDR
jgi:hypothetical protein